MRRRRVIVLAGSIGLVVIVGLVLLPWWLGFAAPGALRRFGVEIGRYERIGYGRFALAEVVVRKDPVIVRISRVELDTPVVWWWRHLRHESSRTVIGSWTVDIAKTSTPKVPRAQGWVPLRITLQRVANLVDRWAPSFETGAGQVRWPGGELAVGSTIWRRRELIFAALKYRFIEADGTIGFSGADDLITVAADDKGGASAIALRSRGASVDGSIAWHRQPALIQARFDSTGWLPDSGQLESRAFDLTGTQIGVPKYSEIHGQVRATWGKRQFSVEAMASAKPTPGGATPPIDVSIHAHGDAYAVTVEKLHAVMPGVTADLDEPVVISRRGALVGRSAHFGLRMDLADLGWNGATGVLTGEADIVPGVLSSAQVNFNVGAEKLAWRDVDVKRLTAEGRLSWPRMEIRNFEVETESGDRVRASGGWDFRQKQVFDGALEADLGSQEIRKWLPPQFRFDRVQVDAKASGALPDLVHSGQIEVAHASLGTVEIARTAIAWHGRAQRFESISLDAHNGTSTLHAAGAATPTDARLTELEISDGTTPLRLTAPMEIRWRPTLAVHGLKLQGSDSEITANLEWGRTGNVAVALQGIRSAWLGRFIPLHGPSWSMKSVAIVGRWNGGPATYSASGAFAFDIGNDREATITAAVHGSGKVMSIDAVRAIEGGNPVVTASGRLPLMVAPEAKPVVSLDEQGPLALEMASVPNAAFWQQLAALTGLEITAPNVSAHLTGTWKQPRGTVVLTVAKVAMDPKRFARSIPSVDSLDLALAGDTAGIRLERFAFSIAGQVVRAAGRLPVPEHGWSELIKNPAGYLKEGAELEVVVPDAEVSMFSRFLPAALAPVGRLQADVSYHRGVVGGYLRLHGAASRPLGPLGVLQQISAEVELSNRSIDLRQVTATAGGQPVKLTGTVELPSFPGSGGAKNQLRYHISLQGENLPFVRQAGLLVRGDVNLKLETPSSGSPAIQGTVKLRDSLFLTDVRAFLPHGGGSSPARRPPFFSVDTPPLSAWTLSIDVVGTRFMRLRTPVFAGTASTRFHLGGTLGAPRAIGEATVDDGTISMPFASFTVQQGSVRLTEEDPYEPTIFLRGTGRHYGYDLTLEITGKASAPDIAFTSSPALDSEQILLMVMTGAAPNNDLNTSTTHRAVQVGAFFGQTFLGSLTGGGAAQERLSIESGEKISLQGKETYSIEYRLNDRWALTGEYDEFDEYNAGFKWRVAPKKGRRGDQVDAP